MSDTLSSFGESKRAFHSPKNTRAFERLFWSLKGSLEISMFVLEDAANPEGPPRTRDFHLDLTFWSLASLNTTSARIMSTIHILRHGQALHNVQRGYPHRDPPLTKLGTQQAKSVQLPAQPDLIIVSPMTRTVQTALLVFPHLLDASPAKVEVQIWPDLREGYDAICNKGVARADLAIKFPQFDFSACSEEWDYPPHSPEDATVRAERVRHRLKALSSSYKHIFLVTHRGFIAFLVQGDRFDVCECRSYAFAADDKVDEKRHGVNCDTDMRQDFGPSLLIPSSLALVDEQVAPNLAATAAAETIHGAVVFSRHGDRTTKWYGAQSLTSLGAEQNYQVGSEYRSRYLEADSPNQILGISEDKYVTSQLFASAPDQGILMNTATAFLQGFYPPLGDIAPEIASQTLNNGTNSTSPIDGYQYVVLHGINDNSPDTIWIKGDDTCPAYKNASKSFTASEVFQDRVDATSDFYASFYDVLSDGVYNLKPENMTYANAYNLFDLVNVARIHNETSPARNVSDDDLFQLRTLADSAELGLNWNASQPARSIGAETLFGVILTQLNQTVTTEGKLKFSLFAGSYDTFMAFFGVAELLDVSPDFYGLPDYASTMTFELFSDDTDEFPSDPSADLRVRWLFKNGTTGELTTYPLFSTDEDSLSWTRFVTEVEERAILDISDWCDQCSATEDFCAAYADDDSAESEENEDESEKGDKNGGMSNAVAGVIGAFVTLGVVGILGAAVFLMKRRKAATKGGEKSSVRSGSTDANAPPSNV
ncbi:hypothetical protein G7Z17_g7864 [Cylindrodendrum hubeiense]|uniref:Phosphoglycerate mutase-like protein n=1 Tax=Cylindrodendrum hubeiense TaxID=595255 RepID=A0A9P5H883_9HYPO|nr:hypothetical protein G7Z17_g7864 [Cylindrodendrum hubeiense]